jgi:hypothetical protein
VSGNDDEKSRLNTTRLQPEYISQDSLFGGGSARIQSRARDNIEGYADAKVVALQEFQLFVRQDIEIGLNAVFDASGLEP